LPADVSALLGQAVRQFFQTAAGVPDLSKTTQEGRLPYPGGSVKINLQNTILSLRRSCF